MEKRRENQNIALNLNNSIWVSASAGSGKTTILVKRLLKLLVSDIDISKIICITYTRTAANEMKSRIYSELSTWVTLNDKDLSDKLKELFNQNNIQSSILQKARILFANVVDKLDDLKIFTIHSFCQQILKKFPIEAGLSPNFEIVEEIGSTVLINEAINEFLTNIDKEFFEKIRPIIKSENEFNELITGIIDKRTDLSYIKGFDFDYKNEIYSILDIKNSDNAEEYLYNFIENIPENKLTNTINSINDKLTESQREKYSYLFEFLKLNYEQKVENIEKYLKIFLKADYEIESENSTRNPMKKIKNISEEYYNTLDFEIHRCYDFWQKIWNIKSANLSILAIEIGLKIIDIYEKLKNDKYLLDYNDLIINTYRLLSNTEYSAWINYKLDNGIDYILLDEAQDTSKMQWLLIQTITDEFYSGYSEKNRTIFVVGDEKQSIFKFQGANIEMFNERFEFYKKIITDSRKSFFKVDLNYSYRSLPNILKFVDTVFEDCSEKISKLTNKIQHSCIRTNENDNGYIEVWSPSSVHEEKSNTNNEWKLDFSPEIENKNKEKLASEIAIKIRDMVQNKKVITIKGKKRNVKYSDIMILFQKRDPIFMSYLIRNLNKNNVPNSGYDKLSLLNDIIIKDFICLLNFTIFPDDDLNLANIIKSPFLNLTEDELLDLCIYKNENNVTLYESIKQKNKKVFLFLNDIIEKSNELSIYELSNYILDNFDNRKKITNRFSESAIETINQFLLLIKNYEDKNTSSLIGFLQSLKQEKIEIKKDLDFSLNQVKLMTVHASKGLQSPITFLITSKFNTKNDGKLIWTENLYESKLPIYNCKKTLNISKQDDIVKEKLYEEYLRLLYVALTRSENELYICSWLDKDEKRDNEDKNKEIKEKKHKSWYDLLLEAIKKTGKQKQFYLDEEETYYYIGEENEYKIIDEQEKINDTINSIIKNIKKCSTEIINKKIINPSQYYKHSDKDNNLINLDTVIIKGNAVHKLLEVLPAAKIEERNEIADIYLDNSFYTLDNNERNNIKRNVLDILEKYKEYFSNTSKSEVPIIGEVDGEIISGQIDRLIIKEREIVIIDYKNTIRNYNNQSDLPEAFIKQLELYKKLVSKIYIDKKIRCYILLTSYLNMIEVN